MILRKLDGNEIPLLGMETVESLDAFYSVFRFVSCIYISCLTELVFEERTKTNIIIVGSSYTGKSWQFTAISKKQWEALRKSYNSYTGDNTVEGFIRAIGWKTNIVGGTQKCHWMVPSMNAKSLIKELNEKAVISNGGAPRFFIDFSGDVVCVDIKYHYEMDKDEIQVHGGVIRDVSDVEWFLSLPSELNIYTGSTDIVKVKNVKGDGKTTVGLLTMLDSTGKATDSEETKYKNNFFYKKYTSRKVTVEGAMFPEGVRLGSVIKINDEGRFIVTSMNLKIPLNEEPIKSTIIASCPVF